MAVTTLYFGASSAGAGDGTSWADRAEFVSGGAINTLISAFDFTSDTLIARIGPGTHTLTTSISTFTGAAGPSASFPCILEGCLSDGSRWQPPDPDWCSAQPAWDADDATYPMPIIATTTNIATIANQFVAAYGIKFTASGRTTAAIITICKWLEWVQVINSTSNTSAIAITVTNIATFVKNVFASCTGSSYSAVANLAALLQDNIRLEGNAAASSGNRNGLAISNNDAFNLSRITVVDNVGGGITLSGTGASTRPHITNCVIADNGGDGITCAGASTREGYVVNSMITGGSTAPTNGINITGTVDIAAVNNRIRDYSSSAITGTLDWNDPPLNGNITTAGIDADEYVNAAGGDYRIKNTSTYWGKNLGAGDEAPAAGGGSGGRSAIQALSIPGLSIF